MANTKKLIQAAAGAAGGEALNVEDVFSTYLYTGTSSAQTITNGIDLDGEGGLVWTKNRDTSGYYHNLIDTERGISDWLRSDATNGNITTFDNAITSFNSDGYSLGTDTYAYVNNNGKNYASWTFRKAPKFFDVVTYTGNGTAGRTVSHNLGSVPGCIIVKNLSTGSTDWSTYHRSQGATKYGKLNTTDAFSGAFTGQWNETEPTDSVFTVGNSLFVNQNGDNYVAYLFAHNDGDGEFGPDGDADIIKCGSYTGNDSYKKIDLGFEPQWVLIKASSGTFAGGAGWRLIDNMRSGARVYANSSSAETGDILDNDATTFEADGFSFNDNQSEINRSGHTYIYIAIRKGPMAVPEDADDVFSVDLWSGTAGTKVTTGFPVDMQVNVRRNSSNHAVVDRVRGVHSTAATGGGFPTLFTNLSNAQVTTANTTRYWDNTGYQEPSYGNASNAYVSCSWRRAPNYFDIVYYKGNSTTGRSIEHNLGVVPEMMWVKCATYNYTKGNTGAWQVYHKDLNGGTTPEQYVLGLTQTSEEQDDNEVWSDTAPTSTAFTVHNTGVVNNSSHYYIAYLFASLDGVSKVFSVTKSSGSDASVNCGFSSGPRFVLLKRTDSTGDWYVWDSERGIVAGNDPYLLLNSTAAEVTSTDYIDPTSNGFTIVNGGLADGDYIGYAVA